MPEMLRLLCTFPGAMTQGSTSFSERKIQRKTMLAHTKADVRNLREKARNNQFNLEQEVSSFQECLPKIKEYIPSNKIPQELNINMIKCVCLLSVRKKEKQ